MDLKIISFYSFIEMCNTAFNLLDEHVLLGNMQIQSFYEFIIDGEILGIPALFVHRYDFISFLDLKNKCLVFILKLFYSFALDCARMVFIVVYSMTIRITMACLAIIKIGTIVGMAHFVVLGRFNS